MQIKIRAKNIKLDDRLKSYINEKVDSLDKFLPGILLARVEVARDRHHRKGKVFYGEILIEVKGNRFYVKEEAQDAYAAIDICQEEMERKLRKFKTKMRDKKRGKERRWKRWVKVWRWKKS